MSIHNTANRSELPKGISYDDALVAVVLRSKVFLKQYFEQLDPSDATGREHQLIMELALDHYKKNKQPVGLLIEAALDKDTELNRKDVKKLAENIKLACRLIGHVRKVEKLNELREFVEREYPIEKRAAAGRKFIEDAAEADTKGTPFNDRTLSQWEDRIKAIKRIGSKDPDVQPDVPAKPMAEEAYHGILGEYVRAWAKITAVNPESILVQALILAGNALAQNPEKLNRPHFIINRTYHPTTLYGLVIGKSGKGKGQGFDIAKALLEQLGDDCEYNVEKQIEDGLGSGQKVIHLVKDTSTKLREKDGVFEEIEVPGAEFKNITIVEKEFAAPLRLDASPTSILVTTYRTLWDACRCSNNVKGDTAVATDARVSIIGHITPVEFREIIRIKDLWNGLYSRFLFVEARLLTNKNRDGTLSGDKLGPYGRKLGKRIQAAREFGELVIAKADREYWDTLCEGSRLHPQGEDLFSCLMNRGRPIVRRIATIFAALDGAQQVRKEHIEAALAIHEHSAAVAYKVFIESKTAKSPEVEHDEVKRFVVSALQRGAKPAGFFTLGKKKEVVDKVKAAIRELEAAGKLVLEKEKSKGKSGRPTTVIKLVNE